MNMDVLFLPDARGVRDLAGNRLGDRAGRNVDLHPSFFDMSLGCAAAYCVFIRPIV
jgi:hypothetical protein